MNQRVRTVADRVAYLARNATEYWELFFGAAKAGVAVVPLNFRLAAGEIEWIAGTPTATSSSWTASRTC